MLPDCLSDLQPLWRTHKPPPTWSMVLHCHHILSPLLPPSLSQLHVLHWEHLHPPHRYHAPHCPECLDQPRGWELHHLPSQCSPHGKERWDQSCDQSHDKIHVGPEAGHQTGGRDYCLHYNIYVDSSGISTGKVWICLRNYLANCTYSANFHGTRKIETPPFHCRICHSTDHPRGLCPFPDIPGWHGSRKCPLIESTIHRGSKSFGAGPKPCSNKFLCTPLKSLRQKPPLPPFLKNIPLHSWTRLPYPIQFIVP